MTNPMGRRPPLFNPGDRVEVRTSKGGAWYEAQVDSRLAGKRGIYLVVYKSLLDGKDDDAPQPLRVSISCTQMRPRPPPPADVPPFDLNQPVEAFYNHGWWPGVVSVLLEGLGAAGGYTVFFRGTGEEINFRPDLVRHRLRWVWVATEGQGKFINSQSLHIARTVSPTQSSHTFRTTSACDNKALSQSHTYAIDIESKNTEGSTLQRQLVSFHLHKKAKKEETREDTTRSADSLEGCPESYSQGFDGTMPKTNTHLKDSGERELVAGKRGNTSTPLKNGRFKSTESSTQGDSVGDQQVNILVNEPSVKGQVSQGDTALASSDGTERLNEALLSTPRVTGDLTAPLSSELPIEKFSLPFEKHSPMWKYIDMEVTPRMRQHPHFRPLEQSPEVQREGIAVGLIMTYHILMESKGGLKMDSSCHNLDETMRVIIDLEGHGFEVQHLRAHLEELRRIKINHEQLLQKKSSIEPQVLERKEKNRRLNAELEATDKAVMALMVVYDLFHERQTSLLKHNKESDALVAKLQMNLTSAKEGVESSELTFRDLLSNVL